MYMDKTRNYVKIPHNKFDGEAGLRDKGQCLCVQKLAGAFWNTCLKDSRI
jgi:hypothetical protein